jgi:hypothetical protein
MELIVVGLGEGVASSCCESIEELWCRLAAGVPLFAGGPVEAGEADAVLQMSTLSEAGVMDVRQLACERLLNSRVELKVKVASRLCSPSPMNLARHCLWPPLDCL